MKKYYAVFRGRVPGIYDNIEDVLEQVDGFEGASFKGFDAPDIAATAFRNGGFTPGQPATALRREREELGGLLTKANNSGTPPADYFSIPEIDLHGWAVDASCLGNPGIMEYRGVELMSGNEIFRIGPFRDATNNIGEFLAIIHAWALMEKKGIQVPVYSDSMTGISWVKKKHIKTQLTETAANRPVFDMMRRGLQWLNTHSFRTPLYKWHTKLWGEIPADFNRKK